MKLVRQLNYDLNKRPFMVIWETTQACDLACKHCRAESQPEHHPNALTTSQAKSLINQLNDFGKPHPILVLTGGDPFKREDIFELTKYATDLGLPVALSPSGTPLLTTENLQRVRQSGCKAISLSLDGSNAVIHDEFRGVPGSFDWTVNGWKQAQQAGLKIQINTTVTKDNLFDLPEIFRLVHEIGAMTWSLFFLVPTGRAKQEDEISPLAYESVMHFLYDASKFISLKTTEGHHYKRVVLQRSLLEEKGLDWLPYFEVDEVYARLSAHLQQVVLENQIRRRMDDRIRRTPLHINAAEGFVFVSLLGEVFPSGYLPMSAGNVTQTSLMDIYQHSDLFVSLRNKKALQGRCGICEYNTVCGGSRSRAYAVTGDVLAEEPFCSYQPGSFPFDHKIFDNELAV